MKAVANWTPRPGPIESKPAPAILPAVIGDYRIIAKIGQGGMSRVMLGVKAGPAGFRKLLVVKQLWPDLAEDDQFVTMFLDEARLAARLDHANLVHTYEVGSDESGYFLVMDYLEGQSLSRLLRRGGRMDIPLPLHIRILSECLAGLQYAHELTDYDGSPLRVVHRDITPSNIFVLYDGQVKLVDFGIAKAAGAEAMTREGSFKGKIAYMAPEQALANPVDRRADIFAVGVLLWEAIARRGLAQGKDDLACLNARIQGTEPRISDVAPDAHPLLVEACERAMAPDPADRFESAEALRDAIQPYLEETAAEHSKTALAQLMTGVFEAERAALRERVEEQLRALDDSGPITVVDLPGLNDPASGSASGLVRGPFPRTQVAPAKAPAPKGWALFGLVLVALAAGSAAFMITVLVVRSGQPAAGHDLPLPAPGQAAAALRDNARNQATHDEAISEQGREQEGTSVDTPSTLTLRIETEPSEAKIYLDGAALDSNPFEAQIRADATVHRVRAVAEGYASEERAVVFDSDRAVRIVMTRLTSPRPRPRRPVEPGPLPSVQEAAPPAVRPCHGSAAEQRLSPAPPRPTTPHRLRRSVPVGYDGCSPSAVSHCGSGSTSWPPG